MNKDKAPAMLTANKIFLARHQTSSTKERDQQKQWQPSKVKLVDMTAVNVEAQKTDGPQVVGTRTASKEDQPNDVSQGNSSKESQVRTCWLSRSNHYRLQRQ